MTSLVLRTSVPPVDRTTAYPRCRTACGLKECRRLGHHIVVVVGHPGYYPRFGFTTARALGIQAPFPCPDEAFMALPLTTGALDGICGMVRYPLAFDTVGAHTS